MAYPSPATIPYLTTARVLSRAVVDVSDSGALRIRDFSGNDWFHLRLTYDHITLADLNTIRTAYTTDRMDTITITGNDGETYSCEWLSEPDWENINGTFYNASVEFYGTRV